MQSKYLDLIQFGKIVIFSKTFCPYCDKAKNILNKIEAKFEVIEIDQLGDKYTIQDKEQIDKLSGITTVPKIFVGKTSVGGCSDLEASLYNGKIFELLQENQISYKQ